MDELTPTQELYQQWLALPSALRPRSLKTRRDIACALGVSPALLRHWETSPGFYDNVFAHARTLLGHQMSDIMMALANEAKRGSVQAAKLVFELLGVHHEQLEHKHSLENDQLVVVLRPELPSAQPPPTATATATAEVQATPTPTPTPTLDLQAKHLPLDQPQAAGIPADAAPAQAAQPSDRPPVASQTPHGHEAPSRQVTSDSPESSGTAPLELSGTGGDDKSVPLLSLYNDPELQVVARAIMDADSITVTPAPDPRPRRRGKRSQTLKRSSVVNDDAAVDTSDTSDEDAFELPWM